MMDVVRHPLDSLSEPLPHDGRVDCNHHVGFFWPYQSAMAARRLRTECRARKKLSSGPCLLTDVCRLSF